MNYSSSNPNYLEKYKPQILVLSSAVTKFFCVLISRSLKWGLRYDCEG